MPSSATPSTDRLDDRPTAARIVNAAADLFARKGYAQTSIQDVAEAVGMLKGSLYYYIDSKEDLLFRVLEDTHKDTIEIYDEVSALDTAPLERLRVYVERNVEYGARNIAKITVYYHDFGLLSPARRKAILAQRKLHEDFVVQLIEEAQELGDVDRALDARVLSYGVFSIINWLYTWYKPRGPANPKHLAAVFGEFAVAGLAGSTAPAE